MVQSSFCLTLKISAKATSSDDEKGFNRQKKYINQKDEQNRLSYANHQNISF